MDASCDMVVEMNSLPLQDVDFENMGKAPDSGSRDGAWPDWSCTIVFFLPRELSGRSQNPSPSVRPRIMNSSSSISVSGPCSPDYFHAANGRLSGPGAVKGDFARIRWNSVFPRGSTSEQSNRFTHVFANSGPKAPSVNLYSRTFARVCLNNSAAPSSTTSPSMFLMPCNTSLL